MHYLDPATFFRCQHEPDPAAADIGLVGIPYSGGQPVERTQYLAPRIVRGISMQFAGRSHRQRKVNPWELARVNDLGDVPMPGLLDPAKAADDIQRYYAALGAAGTRPCSSAAITRSPVRSCAGSGTKGSRFEPPFGLVHFDAHVDTYGGDLYGATVHTGNGLTLALEEGLIDPQRSVQIGINGHMPTPEWTTRATPPACA